MSKEQVKARFANLREAHWVRDMKAHYAKTGTYRPEDLRKLLGDPTKRVEVGPNPSIANYFSH